MTYKTNGTCSVEISYEVVDGTLHNVKFTGGCNGNLKGIGALVEGMKPEDVIAKLDGTKCGFKNTSCPDQLAQALKEYVANAQ
jgi:uncharacterized protein (TIGR03905 family)